MKHYAGAVEYDSAGMVEKNSDRLHETLSNLVRPPTTVPGSRVHRLVVQVVKSGLELVSVLFQDPLTRSASSASSVGSAGTADVRPTHHSVRHVLIQVAGEEAHAHSFPLQEGEDPGWTGVVPTGRSGWFMMFGATVRGSASEFDGNSEFYRPALHPLHQTQSEQSARSTRLAHGVGPDEIRGFV